MSANSNKDYYAVLGVTPLAEDIVIRAAYKALAQRYHPDRFSGDISEANAKMQLINEAYSVLGDSIKKAEYDKQYSRAGGAEYSGNESGAYEDLKEEMGTHNEVWKMAVNLFPDLEALLDHLLIISKALANTYKVRLTTTKDFDNRETLAAKMEEEFLARYFSSDKTYIEFARTLILDGNREAARALNRYITVMGTKVSSQRIIDRIRSEFGINSAHEAPRMNSGFSDSDKIALFIFFGAIFLLLLFAFISS